MTASSSNGLVAPLDRAGRVRRRAPCAATTTSRPAAGRRPANLETALQGALERAELSLRYQPIVDIEAGRVFAVEALLRWHHPPLGDVPPDRFIPVADRLGLLDAFTAWMIDRAGQELAPLLRALPELRVGFNLSATQFVPATIAGLLAKFGTLAPERVTIEVTETALLAASPEVSEACRMMRAAGLRLALDDFGTGFASLDYLERYPIDGLKIDKHFAPRPSAGRHAGRLAGAILAMSQALGIDTVAEGVETAEQLAFYRAHGCRLIQGYLFAAPLRVAELEQFAPGFRLPDELVPVAAPSEAMAGSPALGQIVDAASKLAIGQTRLRDFLDTASDWFWETDTRHRVSWISAGCARFGLVPGLILGRTRWGLHGVDDPANDPDWQAHFADLEARRPFDDFKIASAAAACGLPRHVEISGKPIFDAAGRFVGYRGTARDVSQAHEAELARQRQTAHLELAGQIAGMGYYHVDHLTNSVFWSAEMYRITGRDPQHFQVNLDNRFDIYHPEDRERVRVLVESAGEAKRDFVGRARIIRPDGQIRHVVTKSRCRLDAQGRPDFFGVFQDVTEQVEAEIMLEAKSRENELYRQMIEAMPDDLSAKDPAGRFVFVNAARLRNFGMTDPAGLLGKTDEDILPADYAAMTRAEIDQVLTTGQPFRIERENYRPNGERRAVAVSRAPLKDAAGRIIGILTINRDITERVAMAAALEAKSRENELYRQIVDAIPDDLAARDKDGRYIFANATRAAFFGVEQPGLMIGRRHADFIPGAEADHRREEDLQVFAAGATLTFERPVTWPNGEAYVYVTTKSPLRDAAGQITGVLTLNRDVTGRVAIEATLAAKSRENELFRQMVEAITDDISVKDRDGRFLFANAARLANFGLTGPEQIIGKSDADFFPPAYAALTRSEEIQVATTGQPLFVERQSLRPNAMRRGNRVSRWPLRDAAGEVIGLLTLKRDITDQQAMAAALGQKIQENVLFRQVLETIPDPVWIQDTQGRFLFVNQAAAAALGKTPEDIVGRLDEEVLPAANLAPWRIENLIVMASETSHLFEQDFELEPGRRAWLSTRKAPCRDPQGQTIGVFGHARDITELRQARENALEAHALLQDAVSNLSDGFAIFDTEDRLILCNPPFAQSYGAPAEQLYGQSFAELQCLPHFRDRLGLKGQPFATWLEQRLARHQGADGNPYEVCTEGETFYIREQRTRDGRLVLARTRITALKQAEAELRRLATIDPLTGIPNRRHFLEQSQKIVARCRQPGQPVAVLLADIDHFKQVNDHYGHATGDLALQALSSTCSGLLRPGDIFARWGGEEFVALLPDADLVEALGIAERLRLAAAAIAVPIEGGSLRLTLSVGVALFEAPTDSLDEVTCRADQALYRAKARGRNRVELAKAAAITDIERPLPYFVLDSAGCPSSPQAASGMS